jgi:hypothetical protein
MTNPRSDTSAAAASESEPAKLARGFRKNLFLRNPLATMCG